ncbi:uncharacterized protein LOC116144186 [Pistacia vera]|uniref:uncharacterized protein LOC116144186 n=1 Tax=Pistacia vera TaxID=55513 RepID=UPI0012630A55|nr:uncharacterized protein LOC116144186 [Pistacia vera]
MTTVLILTIPNFELPFEIQTEASGVGMGAVLVQNARPIAFIIRKWSHYLIGRKFIIKTDQRSLQFLMDQRVKTLEQQKWISKLMGYSFEIHYYLSNSNKMADALSRREDTRDLTAITKVQFADYDGLAAEVQVDPKLQVISFSTPVVVLTIDFVKVVYCLRTGWTYKRIAAVVFWEGIRWDVQKFVQACATCQVNKHSSLRLAGLLQPLPIPTQVFDDLSMDIIGGIPRAKGYDTIFVVVDRLTKYSHFLWLAHPYTAKDVTNVFTCEVVKLHGFPQSIVSDRDRELPLNLALPIISKQMGKRRDPTILLELIDCPSLVEDVNRQIRDKNAILEELKHNLAVAQDQMKQSADSHRRNALFKPGDLVY